VTIGQPLRAHAVADVLVIRTVRTPVPVAVLEPSPPTSSCAAVHQATPEVEGCDVVDPGVDVVELVDDTWVEVVGAALRLEQAAREMMHATTTPPRANGPIP
jgi:hypothetical protein